MVTLLCVFRCLQNVFSKNTFLWSIFAEFLVVLGPFWLCGEFDDKYPKKPVSATKKYTSYHITRAFISAYDSMAHNLAAKIHQKWPLLDQ